MFASQLQQMIPQIDILGLFNVNKKLFPTVSGWQFIFNILWKNWNINITLLFFFQLLGTTLTYFFIMYQFYVSEQNEVECSQLNASINSIDETSAIITTRT